MNILPDDFSFTTTITLAMLTNNYRVKFTPHSVQPAKRKLKNPSVPRHDELHPDDRPHLGNKFRARGAESVVDEMEQCVKMGIHEFLMYDDTFTVRKQRVIEICREILRRRLDVGWDIRTRVDTVTPDMIKALRKAGCRGIHYGVESGTDKILKVLNKGITVEQAGEVFQFTRKAGIMVLAYFMIGCPTETRQDIEKSLRVMNSLKPDYAHITILTPFPGT
ncbi:radical SAM protein [bacterium]|nr:radical SAM protein [bacterium]